MQQISPWPMYTLYCIVHSIVCTKMVHAMLHVYVLISIVLLDYIVNTLFVIKIPGFYSFLEEILFLIQLSKTPQGPNKAITLLSLNTTSPNFNQF